MVVWTGTTVLGVLAVADVVRPTSIEAVKALHARGIKVAPVPGMKVWTDDYNNLFKILR